MPTAIITTATSNSALYPGPIASGGGTDDTSPDLSGTISAVLTNGQKVNLYDGNALFAAVTVVNGTNWTFTPATPLIGGVHSFTAEVASFDGTPGARSAAYAVTVLAPPPPPPPVAQPSVTAVTPMTTTYGVATTFTVTGQNLPLTAVMSIADATCVQPPTNRTATGFTGVCTADNAASPTGSKVVTIKTDLQANGGTVIDASKTVAVSAVAVAIGVLTDTGTTAAQCYQAGSNTLVSCTSAGAIALNDKQDGMLGRDVSTPDNSDGKLGFSYSTVGSYAKTECVKDNITGLTWEGKPTSGLRINTATYTNYGDSRSGDASAYATAVNATALCGYTDWRMPTRAELDSLVDYGVAYPGPSIDSTWFPNAMGEEYWSSTGYAGNSSFAWYVYFTQGTVFSTGRSGNYHVRLVR